MAHCFNPIDAHNDLRARLFGVEKLEGYWLVKDPAWVPRDPSGLVHASLISLDRVFERIEDLHLRYIIVEADESDYDVSPILVVGVHTTIPDFNLLTVVWAGLDDGSHNLASVVGCAYVLGGAPSVALLVQGTLDPECPSHDGVRQLDVFREDDCDL